MAESFRLMTYNVHHCRGTDGLHLPHRIAEVIAEFKPDIVALQELDVGRKRTGFIDQPQVIAEYLKMDFHFFPCFRIEEEQFGNAVLSRFPMELIKAAALPTLKGWRGEDRGALWVSVQTPQGNFDLMTTHLGLSFRERLLQVQALLGPDWAARIPDGEPLILCGDLNAFPNSRVCRQLKARLRDTQSQVPGHKPQKTWPTRFPLFRIDHIFVNPFFKTLDVTVPRTEKTRLASDHFPIVASLLLTNEAHE